MRLVLLGAPGAGKGTQAKLLAARFQLPHVSSGDLLRDAVRRETELGRTAKSFMDRGELVPDEVLIGSIEERLGLADCAPGFLLDGFPRTIPQADALAAMLERHATPLDFVVSIAVPEPVLVSRMSGRRTCSQCGALYHLVFDPPKTAGVCDRCGADVIQRDDDQEATIRARLGVYGRQTVPLLEWYRDSGALREVDGTGDPDGVFGEILSGVGASA